MQHHQVTGVYNFADVRSVLPCQKGHAPPGEEYQPDCPGLVFLDERRAEVTTSEAAALVAAIRRGHQPG
ncbi:hypothetical protein OHA25_37385 [Nonomuraea sp. NBC_00507]|uniref:hypothetical protein n=1 Tax=Nonomuraea sp. NBC_00507 TaxID=2976002 RepID=UPI002E170DB5